MRLSIIDSVSPRGRDNFKFLIPHKCNCQNRETDANILFAGPIHIFWFSNQFDQAIVLIPLLCSVRFSGNTELRFVAVESAILKCQRIILRPL